MEKVKSLLSILSCTVVGCYGLLCFPALADQCAYITKEQAKRAISRLNLNQTIYLLCETYGEKIPQATRITNLSMETVDYQDFWQVKVNGKGMDLTYVFIDSGIERYYTNSL